MYMEPTAFALVRVMLLTSGGFVDIFASRIHIENNYQIQ